MLSIYLSLTHKSRYFHRSYRISSFIYQTCHLAFFHYKTCIIRQVKAVSKQSVQEYKTHQVKEKVHKKPPTTFLIHLMYCDYFQQLRARKALVSQREMKIRGR